MTGSIPWNQEFLSKKPSISWIPFLHISVVYQGWSIRCDLIGYQKIQNAWLREIIIRLRWWRAFKSIGLIYLSRLNRNRLVSSLINQQRHKTWLVGDLVIHTSQEMMIASISRGVRVFLMKLAVWFRWKTILGNLIDRFIISSLQLLDEFNWCMVS